MTRFLKEISGVLDKEVVARKQMAGETVANPHFWEEHAKKELAVKMEEAKRGAVVESSGAIRWIKSGNYLPDDYCEILEYGGFNFSREATAKARAEQTEKFLEQYREREAERIITEEELSEMRACFGEGETVVNVITGKKIAL